MVNLDRRKTVFLILAVAAAGIFTYSALKHGDRKVLTPVGEQSKNKVKLYWFIPDGLRADPTIFKIYEWAREGILPNIRTMMEKGSYGYSMPVFPGHTPTNFATLLTGSTPRVHGIADGPMHIEGYPLKMVSESGFSSAAKRVPPIWYTLEQQGLSVTVLSVPGSTPPELDTGTTIRGRWGGWGPDFPAVNFHSASDRYLRVFQGLGNRLFNFGSELTQFIDTMDPAQWQMDLPISFSPPREAVLKNWGKRVYAYIYDSIDDGVDTYDRVLFSMDKTKAIADLAQGQWSEWLSTELTWQTKNDYNINTPKRMTWERDLSSLSLDTEFRIRVIKLGKKDFLRIRFFYNNLNNYVCRPSYYADEIVQWAGPMVDFPDNFPPQLIYYPEDKTVFMEESDMSLNWHRDIVSYLFKNTASDVIIHDTYTPNQMLTSRWWMDHVDPASDDYPNIPEEKRSMALEEIKNMYRHIDEILGEALSAGDENTYIILSSDHGIIPLNREVRLNNLFAKRGLLRFDYNDDTGEYEIDWKQTRAVFLKMDGVYINPDGLDGNYKRAAGPSYRELRKEVMRLLKDLRDTNGKAPVARIVPWEEAASLGLPGDRVGDLIIANNGGYGWVEDISSDLEIFKKPTKKGYKQAVLPETEEGMLTPFIIIGPGVKKNFRIQETVRHIDQYPTIMTLLGSEIPDFVEGEVIDEILVGSK